MSIPGEAHDWSRSKLMDATDPQKRRQVKRPVASHKETAGGSYGLPNVSALEKPYVMIVRIPSVVLTTLCSAATQKMTESVRVTR